MRRPLALAGLVATWAVFMAATAPLRWLGELDAWRAAGLSATGATGTIWNGRLLGVTAGARGLGDLHAGLSATALLGGTLELGVVASDGRGTLLLGRQRGLRAVDGEWPLDLRTREGTLPASLSLASFTAVFRGGACGEASGQVTATIALPGAPASVPPLVLSGAPRCREGVAELELRPAPGAPPLELLVQARADGHYRLTWTARAPEPPLQAALALAGFAPSPEGYTRVDEGRLGGAATAQE